MVHSNEDIFGLLASLVKADDLSSLREIIETTNDIEFSDRIRVILHQFSIVSFWASPPVEYLRQVKLPTVIRLNTKDNRVVYCNVLSIGKKSMSFVDESGTLSSVNLNVIDQQEIFAVLVLSVANDASSIEIFRKKKSFKFYSERSIYVVVLSFFIGSLYFQPGLSILVGFLAVLGIVLFAFIVFANHTDFKKEFFRKVCSSKCNKLSSKSSGILTYIDILGLTYFLMIYFTLLLDPSQIRNKNFLVFNIVISLGASVMSVASQFIFRSYCKLCSLGVFVLLALLSIYCYSYNYLADSTIIAWRIFLVSAIVSACIPAAILLYFNSKKEELHHKRLKYFYNYNHDIFDGFLSSRKKVTLIKNEYFPLKFGTGEVVIDVLIDTSCVSCVTSLKELQDWMCIYEDLELHVWLVQKSADHDYINGALSSYIQKGIRDLSIFINTLSGLLEEDKSHSGNLIEWSDYMIQAKVYTPSIIFQDSVLPLQYSISEIIYHVASR